MQKEIGSNFWLVPEKYSKTQAQIDLSKYGLCGTDVAFLSTGRSAEKFVLETIEYRNPNIKKIALVPPYTCETVISPFIELGYEIHTYTIDKNLEVSKGTLKNDLKKTGAQVVLFHRYFGFDTIRNVENLISEFSQKNVVFIEDTTQCLYSNLSVLPVHYIVGSLRKWDGLPDGGYAICKEGMFLNKPIQYDEKLTDAKLLACHSKYQYMLLNKGEKEVFLKQYQEAEAILDSQNKFYAISPVSVAVQHGIDVDELREKRRENYKVIFEGLKNNKNVCPLTPELENGITPLYYAMTVQDRSALQIRLRGEKIYAPIVWPKPDGLQKVCAEAERIYDEVLCLPMDQRYDRDDMERMIKVINDFYGG